jgi:hypothetical protein
MISQSEGPTGHVGTQSDSKWDTVLPWMGHHFAMMGHKETPTDIILTSVGVMVKR